METTMTERREQRQTCYNVNHCNEHLCYAAAQGFDITKGREYELLQVDAPYRCKHCGRGWRDPMRLCVPAKQSNTMGRAQPDP